MSGIMKAHNIEIKHLDSVALNADSSKIGLNGSSTEVSKIFIPKRKGNRVILRGTMEEVVQKLCQNLKDDKVL